MILHCNFEELGALRKGAQSLLGHPPREGAPVVAPPEGREEVEALLPLLSGDLVFETLADQRSVLKGVMAIVTRLREDMEITILAAHPADETAVASYFLYAHALGVLNRVVEVGQEMEALIEIMTGTPASDEAAATFRFPD